MENKKTAVLLSVILLILLILLFIGPCKQGGCFKKQEVPTVEEIIIVEEPPIIVVEKEKPKAKAKTKAKAKAKRKPVVKKKAEPTPVIPPKITKDTMPAYINKSGFRPFFIYKVIGSNDNHFYPSGKMGNVRAISIDQAYKENLRSEVTSIRVSYDAETPGIAWSGLYWLEPANNWGDKGFGFNLTGAERLSFWARGETGNEVINDFLVGGVHGRDIEDSDTISTGPIQLTTEWTQYVIDLEGADLSNIIGGFAFTVSKGNNPTGCVFYLDHIVFE